MSRKHYIQLADTIRTMQIDDKAREIVAREIAAVCKRDNCRFDYSRFYRACGLAID